MVSAIILAAGASQRMGRIKPLLELEGETFTEHIAGVLRSARILDQVIVIGSEAEEIRKKLTQFEGKITINHKWPDGQLSSIIAGLDAIISPDLAGIMLCPVDHPLISQSLLVDLLQGFWKSGKNIIIPSYQGKRGHPVIFGKKLFDEIRNAPPDGGARYVVRSNPGDILEVSTDEEGVILNVDTPSDYVSLMVRLKK